MLAASMWVMYRFAFTQSFSPTLRKMLSATLRFFFFLLRFDEDSFVTQLKFLRV